MLASASPLISHPSLALLAVRVAGSAVWGSPPFACWYDIPLGLRVPRARSGCPLGPRLVSVPCVCARAPAAYAPPSSGSVGDAHHARFRCRALVGAFHAVRAPPRVLSGSPALPI